MFGELPKLLARDFAIGYFLPAAVFLAATFGLIAGFGLFHSLLSLANTDLLIGTTIVGLTSWIISVILLAANLSIYRIMEGYGRMNPAHLWGKVERKRYKRLQKDILNLNNHIAQGKKFSHELQVKLDSLMKKAAERFPDEEHWLLPTAFGNTIRAFEVYPRVMYGAEAITIWNRLLTVIPKEYRELINEAKTQTDFWLNIWFLGILLVLEYLALTIYSFHLNLLWVPFLIVGIIFFASWMARRAALEWGDWVKGAFDIFLPKLHKELMFPIPNSKEEEKKQWIEFSQAIIYRHPIVMPVRIWPQSYQVRESLPTEKQK